MFFKYPAFFITSQLEKWIYGYFTSLISHNTTFLLQKISVVRLVPLVIDHNPGYKS